MDLVSPAAAQWSFPPPSLSPPSKTQKTHSLLNIHFLNHCGKQVILACPETLQCIVVSF